MQYTILSLRCFANYGAERFFHCSCQSLGRRAPLVPPGPARDAGLKQLFEGMKLSDDEIESISNHEVDDGSRPSLESLDIHMRQIPEDIRRNERILASKIIEKKYFKDIYKIKPGEVYHRRKDPYFKKIKDNEDFVHDHHSSSAKYKFQEMDRQSAYKEQDNDWKSLAKNSPFNPVQFSQYMYEDADEHASKGNSEPQTRRLSSPTEAYCSSPDIASNFDPKKQGVDNSNGPMVRKYNTTEFHLGKTGGQQISRTEILENENTVDYSNYNGPNLLLWSMKEHMRYLHSTDPERWAPEMLSSIFPVNPRNAKLVVKGSWVLEDDSAIARHDWTVLKNWHNRTQGQLGSEAIVRKAIEDRLNKSGLGMSGLPVPVPATEEMLAALEKLQFERPETAQRQGIYPQEQPTARKPVAKYGPLVNIIRDYNAQLDALNNNEAKGRDESKTDGKSSVREGSEQAVDVLKCLPAIPSYEGSFVKVNSNSSTASHPMRESISRHESAPKLLFERGEAKGQTGNYWKHKKRNDSALEEVTYKEFCQRKKSVSTNQSGVISEEEENLDTNFLRSNKRKYFN